jgi:hypothetical protein
MKVSNLRGLYCFKNSHILSLLLIVLKNDTVTISTTFSNKNLFKNIIKAPV